MPLIEEMQAAGAWLFRWRSFLPLAAVLLIAIGLKDFAYPFGDHRWDQAWEMLCLLVSLLGLGTRIATAGFSAKHTSGRNTKRQAAETLNTTGMYSVVRNPLYLGNFLVGLGPALFLGVWWIPVIYSLVFALYYERIILAEEVFLREKFGQSFVRWASATPALIPRVRRWTRPALRFNLRKALRREYRTLLGIVVVFYILETAGEFRLGHRLFADKFWNGIGIVGLAVFLTTRVLHKLTTVLEDRPGASIAPPGSCVSPTHPRR